MPAICLIAAQDLSEHAQKGDIIGIFPEDHEFGRKEGLPRFVRVTITDKEPNQIENFLSNTKRAIGYEVLNSNVLGARCRMEYEVTGSVPKDISLELEEYVLSGGDQELGVEMVERDPDFLVVNIAIPQATNILRHRRTRISGQNAVLKAFRDDINDKFEDILGYRRYCFDPAEVDRVVDLGGEISATANQVDNHLIDKFA